METKARAKRKPGRKSRLDERMDANVLIRTSRAEREGWYEKSRAMGYGSFADCIRALMAAA